MLCELSRKISRTISFTKVKNREQEDIKLTVEVCENESIDGIHYDQDSHTMYCSTHNEPPRREEVGQLEKKE